MMDQSQIRDIITDLEARFPVDQWSINGVHLWPNMRFKLYIHLLNLEERSTTPPAHSTPKNQHSTRFIKRAAAVVNPLLAYFKYRAGLKKTDGIFMGLQMHRVLHQDKWYQRFFDPIREAYPDKSYLHFEMDALPEPVPFSSSTYALNDLLKGFTLTQRLKFWRPTTKASASTQESIPYYHAFIDHIERQDWYDKSLDLSLSSRRRWTQKILLKAPFFTALFKKTRPDFLMMASYYGFENTAAAIFAAQPLQIPTADFQHGPQTRVHMAYAHWTKVPPGGFNTMPSHYWCWDEISAAGIQSWNGANTAQAFGNTWLRKMASRTPAQPQHILYSLQVLKASNLSYFFPPAVIAAIKDAPVPWVLRLHPRTKLALQELALFLEQQGLNSNRYRLEVARSLSLIESLKNSKLHITNFSGSFLEAYQLGIPNLLIDPAGKEIFLDYLSSNLVHYQFKEESQLTETVNRLFSAPELAQKSVDVSIHDPVNLFQS